MYLVIRQLYLSGQLYTISSGPLLLMTIKDHYCVLYMVPVDLALYILNHHYENISDTIGLNLATCILAPLPSGFVCDKNL